MPPGPVEAGFRRPVVVGLVAVGASSLLLSLVLVVVRPESGEILSAGADGFSRSALGHRAFLELLRAEGVPVLVSRYSSGSRAGRQALLLVAEPRLEGAESARGRKLQTMVGAAATALLVLPKWEGLKDPASPWRIASAQLLPEEAAARALHAVGVTGGLIRFGTLGTVAPCEGSPIAPHWSRPQFLRQTTTPIRPLIACPGGILLGEFERPDGARLLVLSDPDFIANHGLGQGQNARLALDIVARARNGGQAVVVDETLHGHERIPSLWREMFAFPLLPSVLQAGLALLALTWSGLGRFGAPLPRPAPLASGKGVLIENTASLLRSAGHSAHTLGRYLEAALADVGRALHAPSFARDAERRAWLEAAGRRRGVRVPVRTLEAEVERLRGRDVRLWEPLVATARRIHRWRQEMLHGPQDHPGG